MMEQKETEPYDPMCNRFAKDMPELDIWVEVEAASSREDFIRQNEGTYNPENGHFLCDECYIKAGMPSSPTGWKCP